MSRRITILNLPGAIADQTAANKVLVGPVDISNFDRFAIQYQNCSTNNAFADLQVQAAADPTPEDSDSFERINWVQIPTATLPQPSALGATASVYTGPVDNVYKWIRVVGRTAISATQANLVIRITGKEAN